MREKTETSIPAVLHKIGTKKCLEKAKSILSESLPLRTLNLRDLNLSASDVLSLARCFDSENTNKYSKLKSISFSYNRLLSDEGAISLSKYLPVALTEIGLVGCGIGDEGGMEILNWIKKSPHLRMICIEQNNFSPVLKSEFRKFGNANPQILVVV